MVGVRRERGKNEFAKCAMEGSSCTHFYPFLPHVGPAKWAKENGKCTNFLYFGLQYKPSSGAE